MSSEMLVKHETRSPRVKGVCFHAKRPWVLCGLHNGAVHIIDYRTGSIVDRYEEHEGPVRGVDFHLSQPIFVTGGDDYKIRVWNFKLRRCLFTLLGHLDFIRTVQFHPEQPWIVSASDDQTLRIWNWQSRSCVTVLTGHNHYVMSAQFHPREDLVVSASLDVTARVWDISGLRTRRETGGGAGGSLNQELFGSTDAVNKFTLEGHDKGVNWASFHPTRPYVVTGADDRTIRIWRLDDTRGYEIEQLRGHTNNVSCVTYYKDLIVSNSEDRSIRVWDPSMRTNIQIYRKDTDRFWVLAAHPEQNLLVAGHDSGAMIFKLERERPAFAIHNRLLYYVRERQLRSYDFETKAESVAITLRRQYGPPTSLSCNPADNTAVLWYPSDGGFFEMLTIPKAGSQAESDHKKGFYTSAVFFGTNKFAVLDRVKQLTIRTTSNDIAKVLPAVHDTDRLFPGPPGFLTCRAPEHVRLYDVGQKLVVGELAVADTRYVVWEPSFSKVAFLSKNHITVATKKLKLITTITDSSRIKSAAFDEERPVLFYTTTSHLKYCSLATGDTGTIRTLENVVYLVRAKNNTVWYVTRQGQVVREVADSSELDFKAALQEERFRDVLRLIQEGKVHGQSLVAYLHKAGHPDIAIHFVSDPTVKFNLALECGMIDQAKALAASINQPDCWRRLAQVAVKYGDMQLALLCNAKCQNWVGMGLGCVVTGNMAALEQVVTRSKDPHFTLQYGLFTGQVEARIAALQQAGQLPLAFTLARSHGLHDVADGLLAAMKPEVAARCATIDVQPAFLPRAVDVVEDSNWPMLPIQESLFTRLLRDPSALQQADVASKPGKAWDDDDDLGLGGDGDDDDQPHANDRGAAGVSQGRETSPAAKGQWDDDDLDIDLGPAPATAAPSAAAAGKGALIIPTEAEPISKHWVDVSNVPAFHVAAGQFQSALRLLERQIGLCDATPLQPYAMQVWIACNAAIPSLGGTPSSMFVAGTAPAPGDLRLKHRPLLPPLLPMLQDRLKQGYAAVTEGRFADAHRLFQSILHQIVFAVCDGPEVDEARELISVAREYTSALNVEICRKAGGVEGARAVELAAYFTHFKLQTNHTILALGQAMTQSFKNKYFNTSASLARRLLDLDPPADRAEKARLVIQKAAQTPGEASKLEYDDRNPFTLCSVSKKPMYRGVVEPIRCSYCAAPSHPQHRGSKCPVCEIGKLGQEAAGIVLTSSR